MSLHLLTSIGKKEKDSVTEWYQIEILRLHESCLGRNFFYSCYVQDLKIHLHHQEQHILVHRSTLSLINTAREQAVLLLPSNPFEDHEKKLWYDDPL